MLPGSEAFPQSFRALVSTSDRQLSYLAEFTVDLRHVPGVQNVVADTSSQPPASPEKLCGISSSSTSSASAPPSQDPQSSVSTVDFAELERAQDTCPDVQKMRYSSSLKMEMVHMEGTSLLCDMSTGVPRPLVPRLWRLAIFSAVHVLAHQGIHATRRLISGRFVWSKMATDMASWCCDCQGCARGKMHRHVQCCAHSCAGIPPLPGDSPTCMWTWWARCQHLRKASHICSLLWTEPPDGQKQFC